MLTPNKIKPTAPQQVFRRLSPGKVARLLGPEINSIVQNVYDDLAPSQMAWLPEGFGSGLTPQAVRRWPGRRPNACCLVPTSGGVCLCVLGGSGVRGVCTLHAVAACEEGIDAWSRASNVVARVPSCRAPAVNFREYFRRDQELRDFLPSSPQPPCMISSLPVPSPPNAHCTCNLALSRILSLQKFVSWLLLHYPLWHVRWMSLRGYGVEC